MCLTIAMKVLAMQGPLTAICEADDGPQVVDMSLIGDVSPGEWVTVHLGIARERMTEDQAIQLRNALSALDLVRNGETDIDHLFADLVGREPPKPANGGGSSGNKA